MHGKTPAPKCVRIWEHLSYWPTIPMEDNGSFIGVILSSVKLDKFNTPGSLILVLLILVILNTFWFDFCLVNDLEPLTGSYRITIIHSLVLCQKVEQASESSSSLIFNMFYLLQLIFGSLTSCLYYNTISQNAAGKLIIWLTIGKKVTNALCCKKHIKKWKGVLKVDKSR